MLQIFGRPYSGVHPLAHALRAFLERHAGTGSEDAPVAFNMVDDYRVPQSRENLLLKSVGTAGIGAAKLKEGFTNFFKSNIRGSQTPDFILPVNAPNRVPVRGGAEGDGLQPGLSLVRLLNLTGLERVYRNHTRHASGEFNSLEDHTKDFTVWLRDKCQAGDAELERFIAATLDMLNNDRKKHAYQPVWAARWDEFKPYLDHPEGATRWRQALGLKPDSRPCWYAVLKYKVGEVGSLFRPSQLDADWSGYHFPSPAGVPVWRGGFPMDCRGESDRPLSEYVHQQIDHRLDHWTLAGRRVKLGLMNDPLGFQALRRRHHDLLVNHFGDAARQWRL